MNDNVDAEVLNLLARQGTRLLATRSTGYNHIDAAAAGRLGIDVVRVTDYSPHSVAEFAVGLLLAVNRKIARASVRTRDGNLDLDGLMGFDLHGKLHCPLNEDTHHIVDAASLARAKRGSILVNTSRGGLVDTEAAMGALKTGQPGGLAIDVYEQEASLFFQDLSSSIITDDVIQRLVSFPNVIVTGHQAFFTVEAVGQIMQTTLESISALERGEALTNRIPASET